MLRATAMGLVLWPANNLSELADASTARTNLGIGSIATHAASEYLVASNNLSDITNAGTARTNLGLGTLATQSGSWQSYSPILKGATEDPTPVTYVTQIGRYCQLGSLVAFKVTLSTSSVTKSTLTDSLRISLPLAAANNSGEITTISARIENATAVLNGTAGEIVANTSYIQFRNVPLVSASALLTYGLFSLGVLTNAITFRASGIYEI